MKKNILLIIAILFSFSVFAQNQPVLAIDGVNTTFQSGLSLPYWLKAGQTLNVVANASSVSIMEFTADSSTLKYSRVISLNSLQTVPSGKVWKIEAIGTTNIGGTVEFSSTSMPTIFTSPKTFDTPGIYSWTVPPNVTSICVEVWGGGGSGGASPSTSSYGGGGGGGGYGYQCFIVLPGTTYTVTVGGANGTSSLGALINAAGGANGSNATSTGIPPAYGGSGGVSTATFNITGANGTTGGGPGSGSVGTGGMGANGGAGAIYPSNNGTAPGGGGAGGGNGYNYNNGSAGAPGKVIIYW